jgi:hypothetical protein
MNMTKSIAITAVITSAMGLFGCDKLKKDDAPQPAPGTITVNGGTSAGGPGGAVSVGPGGITVTGQGGAVNIPVGAGGAQPAQPTAGAIAGSGSCSASQNCNFTCPAGGCVHSCSGASTCNSTCEGGKCVQTCSGGATCTLACPGGGCTQSCSGGAKCTKK